jgi:hypothetical protein
MKIISGLSYYDKYLKYLFDKNNSLQATMTFPGFRIVKNEIKQIK